MGEEGGGPASPSTQRYCCSTEQHNDSLLDLTRAGLARPRRKISSESLLDAVASAELGGRRHYRANIWAKFHFVFLSFVGNKKTSDFKFVRFWFAKNEMKLGVDVATTSYCQCRCVSCRTSRMYRFYAGPTSLILLLQPPVCKRIRKIELKKKKKKTYKFPETANLALCLQPSA